MAQEAISSYRDHYDPGICMAVSKDAMATILLWHRVCVFRRLGIWS